MSRKNMGIGSALLLEVLLLVLFTVGSASAQSTIENDACENAIPITDGTYQGTTVGASVDGSSPGCNTGTGPDVWYLYTATCDRILDVDTCGSHPFDTNLSLQEPGCSGIEVACNDDNCGPAGADYQSRVITSVAVGEQYLVRVSGWGGESGPFELHVSCTPFSDSQIVQGSDHCEDAVELDVPTIVRGTTVGYDYDPEADRNIRGFPQTQGNWGCGRTYFGQVWYQSPGVWYRVTGTGHRMTASLGHPAHDDQVPGVQVYCDGCDRPICVSGGRSHSDPGNESFSNQASWCSRSGQTYLIWVVAYGVWSAGDSFELSVTDHGMPCYGAVDCTPVEVIDTYLSDNGDDDGWADSNETVEMRFTVANRSTRDVTGLIASLSTADAKVAGVGESEVYIGALAAGETKLAPGAFTFRVAHVERDGALDDFLADFQVGFASDQFEDLTPRRCAITGVECEEHADCTGSEFCADTRCAISGTPCGGAYLSQDCPASEAGNVCFGRCSISGTACIPGEGSPLPCETESVDFCVEETQRIRLDLDLDAGGGAGVTEFFESFETGGQAAFDPMNLDAGLNSDEAADGYRCQYPQDNEERQTQACFPGANPVHADAYFWQVDAGRAFSGLRSLYMGVEFGPGEYTTPMASLEAAAIAQPINLAAGHACSGSAGDACALDGDCPPGEQCLAVIPELSFKHQISLVDDRWMNTRGQASASHGVVQVQVLDAEGDPGPWQTIEPKLNRYDSVPTAHFPSCFFDPIDDGSTEDDLFDYVEGDSPIGVFGMRYLSVGGWYVAHAGGTYSVYGPSSNCFPQHVFASAGDTDDPFDPDNLNGPVVGPGLQGAYGPGTWVEPVFSLDRFRGQRIRLRFLASSLKDTLLEVWQSWLAIYSPPSLDDGWWIDDVKVTHTLLEPATVTPDTKDNSGLAFDADGDFVPDNMDCMPGGDQTWALPGEVVDVQLLHTSGVGGTTTLSWFRAATLGATSVDYVVIAEDTSSCVESSVGTAHEFTDAVTPPPGEVRRFLVLAENACGRGTLGPNSLQSPRSGCD